MTASTGLKQISDLLFLMNWLPSEFLSGVAINIHFLLLFLILNWEPAANSQSSGALTSQAEPPIPGSFMGNSGAFQHREDVGCGNLERFTKYKNSIGVILKAL